MLTRTQLLKLIRIYILCYKTIVLLSFFCLSKPNIQFVILQFTILFGFLTEVGFLFLFHLVHRNYVIQYVMELKIPSAMAKLINQLKGHFVRLSTQKCSSHVVEKCLKYFEESRPKIIHELLSVPCFEQLLQDPYANYVVQSALTVTKV